MESKNLDLNSFRENTLEALKIYSEMHGDNLTFDNFEDYKLTPDKPNSARTVIPAFYLGKPIGDMYAIAFLQGDGTGDQNTYKLDQLKIPAHLQYDQKPERVIPRAKTGIIAEFAFPLFSQHKSKTKLLASNLNSITISGNPLTIVEDSYLGLPIEDFIETFIYDTYVCPSVCVTVFTDKKGKRTGDPHCIYFGLDYADDKLDTKDIVQVVGFLAFKEVNPFLTRWIR